MNTNKCERCGLPFISGRECYDGELCETEKNPNAVALGTLGGKSRTAAKINASRKNGKINKI